ncbi:MAG: EAL domain-containing protein [Leptolyngbya sp. UWPOB_LEPTO1]|uniref:EAL domain-containing response regulator n=1 Tax=Leptolyngbya sp. UWPOB_LEPTO1 TaxID=2815653 RepID=UPI001ACC1973|nr:EAL domain-containing response regulator [Leptolyngbya sp. UWPOB_LEPTO1]MBN8559268.1 EAL domain-containing protein [Leptolyngbya sp. UWPOB_LEPTO1]
MKTILIIEDDELIRNNLLEILEFEGFRAIEAENGRIGVQKARAYHPDLVLCDVCMPELDGYGVLEELRSNVQTATMPVIFLTAKSDKSDVRQGMNSGADDYLIKPCSVSELLGAISSRLKKQAVLIERYTEQQQQATAAIRRGAMLDPLTHLPTRGLLYQHLHHLMASFAQFPSSRGIAIFCLNLQRFHLINSGFGHIAGDIVLQMVANRLSKVVQANGFLARLNGDQFGIVLKDVAQEELGEFAQLLLDRVTLPCMIDGHEIRFHANVGMTWTDQPQGTPQDLLTQAETAQHWCQQPGLNRYRLYDTELDALEVERRLIEMDLTKAIERAEFQVHYQPQVDLQTGRVVGMESLVRWHHPVRGVVSPAKFIPIAEELGLIVPLGEWILTTACQHAKRWQILCMQPLRVSVNLSMRQFQQPNLPQRVEAILAETGLDPKLLTLELTESCVMHDVEATILTLKALKKLGIEISIDDFGTGYSSLNHLYQLPIDALKIDRSFVKQIRVSAGAIAISDAIISMAKGLKLHIVAEGIEDKEQLAFFRKRGCDAIQGFLYSPPISAIEMEALLLSDRRLHFASA